MKNIFVKSILVLFFGMFLILTSCAKKNNSSQNRAGVSPRGDAGAVGTTTLGVNKCANGSYTTGRLYNDTAGATFRNAWVDFFSAIFAENQLGEISGANTSTTTGVDFELKLKIVNGQLNLAETKLMMEVRDSFVNQKNVDTGEIIQPIKMNFPSASEGSSLTGTNTTGGLGQFTLVFADNYGKVTVTGSYNQTQTQGTVTFANTKHYNSESARSGTLGNFIQNSCGLFY
ncbi:MAG: hypothetical protein JNL11_20665 [Bdellovibrionaceae bacterium]|nr:hypothetical protein [Pseudobdellovibrionaceae bacterium]